MTQRILFTYIFLLIAAVANSQSPDFRYRGVDPTTDCKTVMEYKVVTPSPTVVYTWDFGDGKTGTGAQVTNIYDSPGKYKVTLTPDGTPANVKADSIEVRPFDFFIAVPDNVTPGTGTFKYSIGSPYFSSANGYTFNWAITGADGYNVDPASTSWEFSHTFPGSGNYNITFILTASSGCTSTKSRALAVTDTIIVPNVFSPDGDGVNDVWSIKSNDKDKLSVKIYSRAGALVYEEHAAVVRWDGKTLFGQELIDGVYYYVVDRDDKVLAPQKGFLYLFRGK